MSCRCCNLLQSRLYSMQHIWTSHVTLMNVPCHTDSYQGSVTMSTWCGQLSRYKFSKVCSIVVSYSKISNELTFENFYLPAHGVSSTRGRKFWKVSSVDVVHSKVNSEQTVENLQLLSSSVILKSQITNVHSCRVRKGIQLMFENVCWQHIQVFHIDETFERDLQKRPTNASTK